MTVNTVVRVHQHGGPECLKLDDLPLDEPQPGQLLIEVQAAGVNFFDTQLRSGLYKQPLALGNEASGLVPPLDVRQLLMAGSVYLTRTGLNAYTATPQERRMRGNDILQWLAAGGLTTRIDSVFGLEAAAHRAIESRGTIGKVPLLPQQRAAVAGV